MTSSEIKDIVDVKKTLQDTRNTPELFVIVSPNNQDEDVKEIQINEGEPLERKRAKLSHSHLQSGATWVENTGICYYDKEVIGSGATSIVYQGFHISPERPAAIKRLILNDQKSVDVYQNELRVWLSVTKNLCKENLNIVQLFEWSKESSLTASSYYFAMELATTDLSRRVLEFQDNPDDNTHHDTLLGYLQDAAKGLSWLHSRDNPIIHRDIKPHNILIFISGNTEIAKLADFGISRILTRSCTGTNTMGVGSSDWMAPEAITALCKGMPFRNTTSMDIFSLGMTFHYAMSRGEHPFKIWEGFLSVNIAHASKKPSHLTDDKLLAADNLCQWMMRKETNKRPTILQVLNHCFFYSKEKSLQFIVDVAKCLSNKQCEMQKSIQNITDHAFLIYSKNRNYTTFDWKLHLGDNVFRWLTTRKFRGKELRVSYDENSAMSLVILIRDKLVHYPDLVEELVKSEDYFGRLGEDGQWRFSSGKYASYFLNKFPGLVPLLWVTIIKYLADKSIAEVVSTVADEYDLHSFKNVPGIY